MFGRPTAAVDTPPEPAAEVVVAVEPTAVEPTAEAPTAEVEAAQEEAAQALVVDRRLVVDSLPVAEAAVDRQLAEPDCATFRVRSVRLGLEPKTEPAESVAVVCPTVARLSQDVGSLEAQENDRRLEARLEAPGR